MTKVGIRVQICHLIIKVIRYHNVPLSWNLLFVHYVLTLLMHFHVGVSRSKWNFILTQMTVHTQLGFGSCTGQINFM